MTEKNKNEEMEEFQYLIDSRKLTDKEIASEKHAILKAREARFRSRSENEKKAARLLQLKFQMEEYLNNTECSSGPHFSKFLNIYVDTLYDKRKQFAADISIDPIMLSQVMNNHRDPQEIFIHRLIIHSSVSYGKLCSYNRDLWPRVFYQDKICMFLSRQEVVRDSEEKYVTSRKLDPRE